MWNAPVVTTAPTAQPISLDDAKAQCRVTGASHDASLTLYIGAAVGLVEKWTGIFLAEQTVTLTRASFDLAMPLPVVPASAVEIKYYDSAGDEQTLDTGAYRLVGAGTLSSAIELIGQAPATTIRSDAVTVAVSAGFLTVPDDIKLACLLLIGHWFDNGGLVAISEDMRFSLNLLLENWRSF